MSLFRIPKGTEHALRSLCCLAVAGRRMSVREIAAQEGIHASSLAKILHILRRQGLVHSRSGRQGGFWLAQDPNQIGLKNVVQIFEGPLDAPEFGANQGFLSACETLYSATRSALAKMTLADLLLLHTKEDSPELVMKFQDPGSSSPPSPRREQGP